MDGRNDAKARDRTRGQGPLLARPRHAASSLAAGLLLIAGGCERLPTGPSAAPELATRGITCVDWTADGYASAEAADAVAGIASTGANTAVFIVTAYQAGESANVVRSEDSRTPRADAVRAIVTEAISHGLRPVLKLHVDLDRGGWRGKIAPSDPAEWFRSYREFVLPWAMLSEDAGVPQLVVGTELCGTVEHGDRWEALIRDVREIFSGEVVYAASWDEAAFVPFWSSVDYVGVDFYFPVCSHKNAGRFEILSGWQPCLERLRLLHAQTGREILLTEIGYRSVDGAGMIPADFGTSGSPDPGEQADLYWAALEATRGQSWIAGVYWWNWLARGEDPEGTDYTPCGKSAEQELRRAWGGS